MQCRPQQVLSSYYQWGNTYNTTRYLNSGTHTLEVQIGNAYATYSNPISLNIMGSITGTTNSIVANSSPQNCDCQIVATTCDDNCYWKVTGNNILNGNNIFGSITNDDIRVL